MSLEKKLSKISLELKEKKAQEEKELLEEKLRPIRAKIKDFEVEKHQLEVILNSLKLKLGQKVDEKSVAEGIGMKEYSVNTENKFKKEEGRIDRIIKDNKEALKTLGLESRDQLLENPDFAGDSEILDYKEAKAQKDDLLLSDEALKSRLIALGIEFNQEDFSYEIAEDLVAKKIKDIDYKLSLEKRKTPEGREELKEELTQYFTNKTNAFNISQRHDRVYKLDIGKFNYFGSWKTYDYGKLEAPFPTYLSVETEVEERYPYDIIIPVFTDVFSQRLATALSSNESLKVNFAQKGIEDFVNNQYLPMAKEKINATLRESELRYEATKLGIPFVRYIEDLRRIIEANKNQKIKAQQSLNEIAELERKLPDEELILTEGYIKVPSAQEDYKNFFKENSEREDRLKEAKWEIQVLESRPPKLFGKEKWTAKLNSLKQEREELEQKVSGSEWYLAENEKVYFKAYVSHSLDLLPGEINFKAKTKDLFNSLKKRFEAEIENEESEAVLNLYEKFKDLERKK